MVRAPDSRRTTRRLVALELETIHVADETDVNLPVTDVIPQSSLADFDAEASTGEV